MNGNNFYGMTPEESVKIINNLPDGVAEGMLAIYQVSVASGPNFFNDMLEVNALSLKSMSDALDAEGAASGVSLDSFGIQAMIVWQLTLLNDQIEEFQRQLSAGLN